MGRPRAQASAPSSTLPSEDSTLPPEERSSSARHETGAADVGHQSGGGGARHEAGGGVRYETGAPGIGNRPADARAGQGGRAVLTVPNGLTALRLALVPVFLWLLLGADRPLAAAALLGVLGATDFLDGFLARRLSQVSALGRVLDPVADRVLVAAAALGGAAAGALPVPLVVVVLTREVLVSVGVVALALGGAGRIDVRFVGKAGTFALLCALPLFIAQEAGGPAHGALEVTAWVLAGAGVVLGWVAVVAYVPPARVAWQTRGHRERVGDVERGLAAPDG